MAMTLDSFLNVTIPLGIIVAFALLFYWKLKEPINGLAKMIWNGLSGAMEKNKGKQEEIITTITYRN